MISSRNSASSSQDSLSKAIKVSIAIHVAVFVLLILKDLVMPSAIVTKEYLPSLKVDLVALPDKKVSEVVTPTQPALPEEAKPTSKPEPVAPKADDDDFALKKKTLPKTKEQKKKEEHQDKMNSALARIKALEKIKAGETIKGNKVMKGSSAKGVTTESAETIYMDVVRDKISSEWELPQWLQDKNFSAKVLVKIDRRGMISIVRFLKNSGNAQFDAAVKRTLQIASPLPVPPIAVLPSVSQDGIVLGFPLAD